MRRSDPLPPVCPSRAPSRAGPDSRPAPPLTRGQRSRPTHKDSDPNGPRDRGRTPIPLSLVGRKHVAPAAMNPPPTRSRHGQPPIKLDAYGNPYDYVDPDLFGDEPEEMLAEEEPPEDRKSTRLNSSHSS